LKQSPKAWFDRLTIVMKKMRYKQNLGDHILFIKHSISWVVCNEAWKNV